MSPFYHRCAWVGLCCIMYSYLILGLAVMSHILPRDLDDLLSVLLLVAIPATLAALVLGILGNRYIAGWVAIVGAVFWPVLFFCLRML